VIEPRFPTQLSSASCPETKEWRNRTTPTPPTLDVPPKIVVNHPYYRVMSDCGTYALDNKAVVYKRRQASTLGRRKEVAQSFGVQGEWDGSPPVKLSQFLRTFAQASYDNDISEGEAVFILQGFTKEPLKSKVMMVMPTRRAGNPSKITSYLKFFNWMLRRHVYEASVATLVETLNVAVQRADEDEFFFAERLRRLNSESRFMVEDGALKGRFLEDVHHAKSATLRAQNTPAMTMGELARFAQTEGDKHRWLRLVQLKDRTKEREALAKEARLRRQARAAALPQVAGGIRGYSPRDAPVRAIGAVGAPTPGPRYDASRPKAPGGSTPGGGDNQRYRPRPRDEPFPSKPRAGEYRCW